MAGSESDEIPQTSYFVNLSDYVTPRGFVASVDLNGISYSFTYGANGPQIFEAPAYSAFGPAHRHYSLMDLEWLVLPPLALNQFALAEAKLPNGQVAPSGIKGRPIFTASRRNLWRNILMAAGLAACMLGAVINAQAQTPTSEDYLKLLPPDSKDFLGLLQNYSKPLEIEATLVGPEVGGVERYGGNESWVIVRLGDTTIESRFVTVYYERSQATPDVSTAELRKSGLTHILKLEASGDVLLTYKDQSASGDKALFYIRENKVWFNGNVALTRKQDSVKGGTLLANLTTGRVTVSPPNIWKSPQNGLEGSYPPVYEIWGQPNLKNAR